MRYELITQLIDRIKGYPVHEVAMELAVIGVAVYIAVRVLHGTRGARVVKGLVLILLVATPIVKLFTSENEYPRLNFLYNQFFTIAMIALVVVFQPELRRALVRLGDARFLRGRGLTQARVIEEIVAAVGYLSKNKIGALIAIEGQMALENVVADDGTRLDAEVSRELLNTIFWPGSALHDMAVIVRDDRVIAAGVQLPLAEGEKFVSELGSRHRAAIGVSQESDATVVVVSEETGIISIARGGKLVRNLSPDGLQSVLSNGAEPAPGIPPGLSASRAVPAPAVPETNTPPIPKKKENSLAV